MLKKIWKKVRWNMIFILFLAAALLVPVRFPQSVNQDYDGTVILMEYDFFGCGTLVRKVVKGGEALVAGVKDDYPEIGENEIKFTEDSDEPIAHYDYAEFATAGLASGVQYIVRGELSGVTPGASKCCEPEPAYHDTVPLFRVKSWAPTVWLPYLYHCNYLLYLLVCFLLVVSACVLLLRLVWHWTHRGGENGFDSKV